MKHIALFFLLVLFACGRTSKPEGFSFKSNTTDTSRIRLDGFYNLLDTAAINYECPGKGRTGNDIYTSIRQVIFTNEKKIYVSSGGTVDNAPYTCEYYKEISAWHKKRSSDFLGNYFIKNDSIYAYLPITFKKRGMVNRTYHTYYRGFIKSKDSITDWKVVRPYPKGIGKWEIQLEQNQNLFLPQTLYFVETDAVRCLTR